MAKMFYSIDEVQEKLGLSEEQVRQLVQDGRLREFKDGARMMYKVDEVEKLAGDVGDVGADQREAGAGIDSSGSEIALLPLDSSGGEVEAISEGGLLGGDDDPSMGMLEDDGADLLAESGEITLADTGSSMGPAMDSGDQIPLMDGGAESEGKDDTVMSQAPPAEEGTGASGINVLDGDEELELADPLAQTQIAPDIMDQVDLESGSGGSGLLDTARAADDTSLGPALLDEIYPTQEEAEEEESRVQTMEIDSTEVGPAEGMGIDTEPVAVAYRTAVEVYDPSSWWFGLALVIPFLMLVYLAIVSSATVMGAAPKFFFETVSGAILWVMIGAAVISGGIMLMGWFLTNLAASGSGSKPKKAKAAKPKKEKPKKEKKAKGKKKKK